MLSILKLLPLWYFRLRYVSCIYKYDDIQEIEEWISDFGINQGETFLFRVFAENPAGRSPPEQLSSPVTLKTKKGKKPTILISLKVDIWLNENLYGIIVFSFMTDYNTHRAMVAFFSLLYVQLMFRQVWFFI